MPAVAVTDRTNFFGLIKAYKAAEREGVKLIVGADFQLLEDDERRSQVTFLAQNHVGYRNLTILISRAYQEGQILGKPLLRREWIAPQRDGLLVLSGGAQGRCRPAFTGRSRPGSQDRVDLVDGSFSRSFLFRASANRP